ncbi:MAG: cysteine-rich CWC family protein [Burkholderiales bacterium]|nr:cysteine-rich CWC family protein [Burkholderiales bacterium]
MITELFATGLRARLHGDNERRAGYTSAPAGTTGRTAASGDANRQFTAAACPKCGDAFNCGASAASCWCQSLPPLNLDKRPADWPDDACLCGRCLGAAVAEQIAR